MNLCANTSALNAYMREQDEDERATEAYEAEKASHAKALLRRLPDLSDAITSYLEDEADLSVIGSLLACLYLANTADTQRDLMKLCQSAAERDAENNVSFRSWAEIKAEHAAERADYFRDETR